MSFGLTEHFTGAARETINRAHFDVLRPGGLAFPMEPGFRSLLHAEPWLYDLVFPDPDDLGRTRAGWADASCTSSPASADPPPGASGPARARAAHRTGIAISSSAKITSPS